MSATASRRNWIEQLIGLIGADKANEVIADTEHAADQLDKAGIERKAMKPEDHDEDMPPDGDKPMMEEDETKPEGEAKTEGDMVSEVGAKLAQQIMDAAGGDLTSLSQEQLAVVIADALRPAVEEEPTPDAAPPPSEEQTMEDNNKAASTPAMDEAAKAFSDLLGQMVSDQGAMAKAYTTQSEELVAIRKELAETKALAPLVEDLVKRLDALKAQLGDRPRQASAASETTIDPESDAAKALESAIKKGTNGNKKVLGIAVRE